MSSAMILKRLKERKSGVLGEDEMQVRCQRIRLPCPNRMCR